MNQMKVFGQLLFGWMFIGFCFSMPIQAQETQEPVAYVQEVEPTPSEEVSIESTEVEPTAEPELEAETEPEVEPVVEPEPVVLNGWQDNNTKYYVDNVAVNGVQKIGNDYYLFQNESLKSFTGVVKNSEGQWIHLKNGKSDFTFTGFSKSIQNDKWYFSRNGKLDWNFTGVAKSVADNKWYHAKNGALDWNFTGLSKSVQNNKWYFSRKGVLDWSFTGVAKSIANNKWYHAKNGALDWNFTGLSKSVADGNWYVSRNGALDWNFTGVAKSIANNKWYYARKGKLDWSYTGLGKSIANNKLYYVKKGSLDWSKNGYYKNNDGKRYNITKGLANPIRYVIAIDPGHGGSNSGTYSLGPHWEKTLNLVIAKFLQAELSKHKDVYVVMTRVDDSFVGLEERPEIAKRYDADYFISLHLNATVSHSVYGAEVYYQNTNYRPDLSRKSKALAQSIQNELVGMGIRDLGIKVRNGRGVYADGSMGDYYKVIRHSKLQGIPGILIEHCFADHSVDYYRYLNTDAKLKQLALADYRGIKKALSL